MTERELVVLVAHVSGEYDATCEAYLAARKA